MQMKPLSSTSKKTLWKEVVATLKCYLNFLERDSLKYRMLVKIESQEYLWGAVIHCPNTLCQLWQALKVYAILSLLFFEVWHLEFTCSSTKKYFQFQPVAKQFKATKNDPFAWYSDRVFNKFLPFDFCILHLGSKKWTLCSNLYCDLELGHYAKQKFQSTTAFLFSSSTKNHGIV